MYRTNRLLSTLESLILSTAISFSGCASTPITVKPASIPHEPECSQPFVPIVRQEYDKISEEYKSEPVQEEPIIPDSVIITVQPESQVIVPDSSHYISPYAGKRSPQDFLFQDLLLTSKEKEDLSRTGANQQTIEYCIFKPIDSVWLLEKMCVTGVEESKIFHLFHLDDSLHVLLYTFGDTSGTVNPFSEILEEQQQYEQVQQVADEILSRILYYKELQDEKSR